MVIRHRSAFGILEMPARSLHSLPVWSGWRLGDLSHPDDCCEIQRMLQNTDTNQSALTCKPEGFMMRAE